MKNIQSEYISKVVEIMKNNEITEVTMDDGKTSMYIKSATFEPVIKDKTRKTNIIEQETTPIVEEPKAVEEKLKEVVPIKSQMIGLYYAKPTPAEAPFVKVGDLVKVGQVICVIETIKLVNKITSDVEGKIVEICIEDGKPVEYGQVIMYVEKN